MGVYPSLPTNAVAVGISIRRARPVASTSKARMAILGSGSLVSVGSICRFSSLLGSVAGKLSTLSFIRYQFRRDESFLTEINMVVTQVYYRGFYPQG